MDVCIAFDFAGPSPPVLSALAPRTGYLTPSGLEREPETSHLESHLQVINHSLPLEAFVYEQKDHWFKAPEWGPDVQSPTGCAQGPFSP